MSHQEIVHLIAIYGYWGIALGATVDSFGMPVPGEVMVLSAGMYAGATHRIALLSVIGAAMLGAMCGDNASYALGRYGGAGLIERYGHAVHFGAPQRRIARYFFCRYGGRVALPGRFLPVIHIGVAFLAGTQRMSWARFALFNALACLLWASGLGGAGYLFGAIVLGVGDIVAAASVPLALGIALAASVALRLAEHRLQRRADRFEAEQGAG